MFFIRTFFKAVWIGGTLTVPGVSGGSMAMLLGIYERLVLALNSLTRPGPKKESISFLTVFCIGAGAGILALSGPVVWLLRRYPAPMAFLFAGAVAGGIPVILRSVRGGILRWYHILCPLAGGLVIVLISALPEGLFTMESGWLIQLIGGVLAAAALVLPGISVSHVLYVLGLYTGIMERLSSLDFLSLLPFMIGLALGILLTARALEYCLFRFQKGTYLTILGFVLASVADLLSGIRPADCTPVSFLLFAVGLSAMILLFRVEGSVSVENDPSEDRKGQNIPGRHGVKRPPQLPRSAGG